MPLVQINALDSLFFRDGKPFSMGDDSFAQGIFPPPPSVIYGALRSAFFIDHPEYIASANTLDDPTLNLNITQIAYFQEQHRTEKKVGETPLSETEHFLLFPTPFDVVTQKKSTKSFVATHLQNISTDIPLNNQNFNTQSVFNHINIYEKNVKTSKGFMKRDEMSNYLRGRHQAYNCYETITQIDPKIGIGRENTTRFAEEGKLYRINMHRLDSYSEAFKKGTKREIIALKDDTFSLIVRFELEHFEDWQPHLIRIGGDGRAAIVKNYAYPATEKAKCHNDLNRPRIRLDFSEENPYFKLYFSTPTIFKKGILPKDIDTNNIEGLWNGINIGILAAFSERPQHIGGFDMKKKRPKPMYKALPAGTVFYCKVLDKNIEENAIFDAFHEKALSDIYPEQGFGIAYVGKLEI